MKFLSVRNRAPESNCASITLCSGSGALKKGWALPVKLKPQADKIASYQAFKLDNESRSITMGLYKIKQKG